MLISSLVQFFVLLQVIHATTVTFVLEAHQKECLYVLTEKQDTMLSFYFSVLSGGSFDIDYTIKNPRGEDVEAAEKAKNAEFVFRATHPGEYEFCFSNGMSTFAKKVVDFEVKVENSANEKEFKAQLPDLPNSKPIESVEGMKRTVDEIDQHLNSLARALQYYKTRNNRNQDTVKSTESRIYYFSIFEVLLMVGMAFLQITVVQLFFKGSRKQLV